MLFYGENVKFVQLLHVALAISNKKRFQLKAIIYFVFFIFPLTYPRLRIEQHFLKFEQGGWSIDALQGFPQAGLWYSYFCSHEDAVSFEKNSSYIVDTFVVYDCIFIRKYEK